VPSPIAHLAVASLAPLLAPPGSPLRGARGVAALAFASLLPDADLLLVAVLPGGIVWHHGPTHALVGAAALGVAAALAGGLRGGALAAAALVGATHPLLDALVGEPGGSSAYGVPLFWPASDTRYVSPVHVFAPYRIDEPGFLANMWSPRAVGPYLRELAFAAVVVASGWAVGRPRRLRAGA
jgi:membrane-bound metal-dependent hydrolase YbcI (DUF457 family)